MSIRFLFLGFLFAAFWASASVAAKFGLKSVQPLVLYQARFLCSAVVLMAIVFLFLRKVPTKEEIKKLALFGFLNITLSLGLFAFAIKEVAAGIGALQVGINPLMIAVLSAVFLGKSIHRNQVIGLFLAFGGVATAVYPLLENNAYATPKGLLLLGFSMLSYSSAAVYYSSISWQSKTLVLNAWQSVFGALFLLPATFYFYQDINTFDQYFWGSTLWLGVPLSVFAVFLWLYLLKIDGIKASYFLFLCPIFGFIYAYFLLNEPFTWYTLGGLVLVLIGILLGQKVPKNRLSRT